MSGIRRCPAHEVVRLRRNGREGYKYASIPLCPRIPSARQGAGFSFKQSSIDLSWGVGRFTAKPTKILKDLPSVIFIRP